MNYADRTPGRMSEPPRRREPDVTTSDLSPAEQAAWQVAVERGLPITAADLRALLAAAAPVITRNQQDELAPIMERAMAYNPDVADLIMAAYRLGRTHQEPAGYPFESELRPERLDDVLPSGERRVFRGTFGSAPAED